MHVHARQLHACCAQGWDWPVRQSDAAKAGSMQPGLRLTLCDPSAQTLALAMMRPLSPSTCPTLPQAGRALIHMCTLLESRPHACTGSSVQLSASKPPQERKSDCCMLPNAGHAACAVTAAQPSCPCSNCCAPGTLTLCCCADAVDFDLDADLIADITFG